MRFPLSLALVLALAAGGCNVCYDWKPAIAGSGNLIIAPRQAESFDGVSLAGGMELYIRVGLPERVIIHADDNLQEHITTRVEDGQLRIKFEESVDSDHTLRADIDLPELSRIDIAGSSRLTVIGVEGDSLAIDVAGSCRGEVSGWVDRLTVDIAGSAKLDLLELRARRVDIDIAGSGNVQTNVTEELEVDIAGSGTVGYRGDPSVGSRMAGSGSVRKVE